MSESRSGVQCPSCGSEMEETEASRKGLFTFPSLECPKTSCHTPVFVYGVSRDGKFRLTERPREQQP